MQSFQIVEETSDYSVEVYGTLTPFLLTEAILQADRSINISVQLNDSGWGCLVCGRKLFVWRFASSPQTKFSTCCSLALPASELCHSAKLVCLFPPGSDKQTPSVLSVSPEGVIRFWQNLHNELVFYERGLELAGQECFALTYIGNNRCVLSTTSNQMFLISISNVNMQTQVDVHTLKPSQGMFARVSYMIFGYSRGQTSQIRQVRSGSQSDEGCEVYVVHDEILQKWIIGDPGTENVVYEKQLSGVLVHHFQREFGLTSVDGLKAWLLDVQCTANSVVLLAAATNMSASSPRLHYALVELKPESTEAQDPVEKLHLLQISVPYLIQDEVSLLDCHLLLPNPSNPVCFIYSKAALFCSTGQSDRGLEFQEVKFSQANTTIWGAGSSGGQCIFFTNHHGLVTVKSNQTELPSFSLEDSIVNESRLNQSSRRDRSRMDTSHLTSRNESLQSQSSFMAASPLKLNESASDGADEKLKGLRFAFLSTCRGNLTQAENLVGQLFPRDGQLEGFQDSPLDSTVVKLSLEIINDFPASDPRWAESLPQDYVSATGSLILMHQLEDKMKAFELLITFLKNSGLWDRFHSVTNRELGQTTFLVLAEHAQKLAAMKALSNQHTSHPNLIDAAITRVMNKRGKEKPPSGLTVRDVFYTKASQIEGIFEGLLEEEIDLLGSDLSPKEAVTLVSNVNSIFLSILQKAWHVHQSKSLIYQPHDPSSSIDLPYLPWTASSGQKGVRLQISRQHAMTVAHGLNNAEDASARSTIFQQLLELIDLQLEGYVLQLESLKTCLGEENVEYGHIQQKYQQDRSALIRPFIEHGQIDRVASLAEKFCDFATLVEICDRSSTGTERFEYYMNQFKDQGFSDFVFKFYFDRGERGKLMNLFAHRPELESFLHHHGHLGWIQDVHTQNYALAQDKLRRLSEKEKQSVAKKKTLLSLSKLTALACDDVNEDEIQYLNDELSIISHQEQLPAEVIDEQTFRADDMPVLQPDQIIELYISDINSRADEFDFKKSLDLLLNIPEEDESFDKLRMKIWCQAVKRDNWNQLPGFDPWENCKETVFFKTALKACQEDMHGLLPTPDELFQAEELASVRDSKNFQYLLKMGYEQLRRS